MAVTNTDWIQTLKMSGKPTQQTCHFVSFLLLDGLVVQSLEEHVQNQDVVSAKDEICPTQSKNQVITWQAIWRATGNTGIVGGEHTCYIERGWSSLSPSFAGLEEPCGQQRRSWFYTDLIWSVVVYLFEHVSSGCSAFLRIWLIKD